MKQDDEEVTVGSVFVFEAVINRALFDKEFAVALEKGKIMKVEKVLKEMGVSIKRKQLKAMLAGLKQNDLGVVRQLAGALKKEDQTGV